jgi:hypothetical protein
MARTLQRASPQPVQAGDNATSPTASRPAPAIVRSWMAARDADGHQKRAGIPAPELQAYERSARRVGGQERPGEELPGAAHELRYGAHDGKMKRQPVPRCPTSRGVNGRDRRRQEADAGTKNAAIMSLERSRSARRVHGWQRRDDDVLGPVTKLAGSGCVTAIGRTRPPLRARGPRRRARHAVR